MSGIDIIFAHAMMAAWFTWFSKPTPAAMWAWVFGTVLYYTLVKPLLIHLGLF